MTGTTTGGVRTLLRLEGLAIFLAALAAYDRYGVGWKEFAIFFLVPDLSFAAYLAGPRIGAIGYNAAHSIVGAAACLAVGVLGGSPPVLAAGLIWLAHIGFDRMMGYGLKYARGFGFTHLGLIGKTAKQAAGAR